VDANYRYQPNMRFAESERETVAARLRDAHADGRLTYEEFSKRLDDLYEATTYADLAPIVADLRQSDPARSLIPGAPSGRPAVRPSRRHGLVPIFVVLAAIWFIVVVGHGIVLPFIFWILVLFVVMRIVRHRRRSSYR
jgi:Flp pilus assembly protein TadB